MTKFGIDVSETPNLNGLQKFMTTVYGYRSVQILSDEAPGGAHYNVEYYPQDDRIFYYTICMLPRNDKEKNIKLYKYKERSGQWKIYMSVD
jgi:hypothetical protein